MLSFHNDPAVKAKYVERMAAHIAADELVQGVGFESNGVTRGCFVGCTLNRYDHKGFATELGLPEWLARLGDQLHEGMPKAKTPWFADAFLKAIPVGVDVERVKWQLAIWRHERDLDRLKDNKEPYAQQVRDAIQGVIDYCMGMLNCIYADDSASAAASASASVAWSAAWSAESAARSAERSAESAARSAEWSAWSAAWSAESAARSAEWSAESAARSAESAARSAARSNHFVLEAEMLLKLLAECK